MLYDVIFFVLNERLFEQKIIRIKLGILNLPLSGTAYALPLYRNLKQMSTA